jgi:predicted DsbA family dithiol-disulfide isomerase
MTCQPLTVEIWSDLICPWCWIGKRRFERALAGFAARDKVQIIHHPYRLAPGAAAQPIEQALAERYRLSPAQIRTQLQQITHTAAAEGLEFQLDGTALGDTLHAHRLVQFATTLGLQEAMIERCYRAYFSERRSIFSNDELQQLATDVGLPRDAAAAVLDSDRYAAEVLASQQRAHELGARGVPLFVIGGRHAVSGAQSPEHFAAALNLAWTETAATTEPDNGDVCGSDGCIIPQSRRGA